MEEVAKDLGFSCVIHGSYRKYFDLVLSAGKKFTQGGIEVSAPNMSAIVSIKDGFIFLDGEENEDPRLLELRYLSQVKRLITLSNNDSDLRGFSYFINPDGKLGTSTSYELGIAQAWGVPYFFYEKPVDHPIYLPPQRVIKPEQLIEYIQKNGKLPTSKSLVKDRNLDAYWRNLMQAYAAVSVGCIVEYCPQGKNSTGEVLLVRTHKWNDQFSIVGGKVFRGEKSESAYLRVLKQQTGLTGSLNRHLATFDPITTDTYWKPDEAPNLFVDRVVSVDSRRVHIDGKAEEFIWLPAQEALDFLALEPNARYILERYLGRN